VIRIASWNVELGKSLPLILDGLGKLPAFDVLALQELSEHGGEHDAVRIAAHLGPGWRWAQATAQLLRGQHQANGFVWNPQRLTALHISSIGLPPPSGRMMRRLPPSQRNAAFMEARIGERSLRLYSVHLDVLGIAHKHAQFARVMADAGERPAVGLTVIAGDLNTYGVAGRPRWQELRRVAEAAGFEELTAGIGWTHRGLGVRQKLDAIFVSPAGLPHRRQRVVLPGSDHIPLWAEIS
jgi:endonuclease/exonuclease/phosphatase family metal-dependent hydrolase